MLVVDVCCLFFFFKPKTAYEMRISDWSSDVCSSDLSIEALEQVRLLTNLETDTQKLLQVILIGQPELRELLARDDLRQLAQRITARFHLVPLDEAGKLGRASCRERVCQYGEISVVAVSLKKKDKQNTPQPK